jgi:hypothetical protein
MTALTQFARLETTGLWRAGPDEQRREVLVSLGDATLTISDKNNVPLTHWSLGAVKRVVGSGSPAIYHPDTAPEETLELGEDAAEMIAGLDKVLRAIERRRPSPGKLRLMLSLALAAGLAAAAALWVPDALERYTVKVVPEVKRAQIGARLLEHITRLTGQACQSPEALPPLQRLTARVLGDTTAGAVVVLPDGVRDSAHLPGGIVLLNRTIVEVFEDPDVAAGYILAERVRATQTDPLADLIDFAGLRASLMLVTTGSLPDTALTAYAEHLITRPSGDIETAALLDAFAAAELRSTAYAYARDITGESVLPLIEGDPMAGQGSRAVLSDADWVRLQGICAA